MRSIQHLLGCFSPPLTADTRDQIHDALDRWVNAAPAREQRRAAARAIWACHRTQGHTLSLVGMNLSSLPECMEQLRHVRSLLLSDNAFSRMPEGVFQMPQLISLVMSRNQLRELSPMVERLVNLTTLLLDENALRQLPEGLCALPQLVTLSLGSNQLETLPDRIGDLFSLRSLTVQDNQLARLPESIGQLRQLRVFNLSNNRLEFLPECLVDLPALERFAASDNQLHALPAGFELLEARVPVCGVRGNFLLPAPPRACTRDAQHGAAFREWYRRLERTQDFAVSHARLALVSQLSRLFEAIESDTELRQVCLSIADEAIGACEDRVAWGLTQMGMALENRRAERGELTERDLFLMGRAQFRLNELHRLAEAHIENETRLIGRRSDAIEVHLAFQTGLRERLGLPLAIQGMLYAAGTRVQDWELSNAEQRVRTSERSGVQRALDTFRAAEAALAQPDTPAALPDRASFEAQRLAFSLAHYMPWQQHVARSRPHRLARLQSAAQAFVANADTRNEAEYKRACDMAMFLHNHGLAYCVALEHLQATPHTNRRWVPASGSRGAVARSP